jgi:hypothetical protein
MAMFVLEIAADRVVFDATSVHSLKKKTNDWGPFVDAWLDDVERYKRKTRKWYRRWKIICDSFTLS